MAPAEEVGLVWFRRDLRLDDNPAWAAATTERRYVVPLYVIDPRLLASVGPYRRRQLIANLQALDYDLFEATGGRLLVRFGDPREIVPQMVEALSATALFYNADVSATATKRDEAVTAAISVPVRSWYGSLVLPPGSVVTAKGALSKVFNAFHKAWLRTEWDEWPEPQDAVVYDDPGEPLPRLDGPAPYFEGPKEAHKRLDDSLARIDDESTGSDAVAQLSADLRYGTLSARAVVTAVGDATPARKEVVAGLARRDWFAHQLARTPELATESQVVKYRKIAWGNQPARISAWKGGFTGFPYVDAAMRELRETGKMPGPARVAASSFLVKDLFVDWRIGEKHLRHLLVDADPAQDAGTWQWVAGTGNDAAPINKVIDPVEESRREDPSGAYIRRWVPELAALDDDAIHAPWTAPEAAEAAGVRLGHDYPEPIVDHDEAREAFVASVRDATSTRRRPAGGGRRPAATSTTGAAAAAPAELDADRTDGAEQPEADTAAEVTATEPDDREVVAPVESTDDPPSTGADPPEPPSVLEPAGGSDPVPAAVPASDGVGDDDEVDDPPAASAC